MFTLIDMLPLGFYKRFEYNTLNQFTCVMLQAKHGNSVHFCRQIKRYNIVFLKYKGKYYITNYQ